jgi:NTP pyrophosphatase (non-canonical NTP hydrolase)
MEKNSMKFIDSLSEIIVESGYTNEIKLIQLFLDEDDFINTLEKFNEICNESLKDEKFKKRFPKNSTIMNIRKGKTVFLLRKKNIEDDIYIDFGLIPEVNPYSLLINKEIISNNINILVKLCYGLAKRSGWHDKPVEIGTRLALIHSEVSEALEGFRKDLNDDHLPHRKMAEVELADAVIRIFDLAGALNFDIGNALLEKLEYNQNRADHKKENREKEGGKKF